LLALLGASSALRLQNFDQYVAERHNNKEKTPLNDIKEESEAAIKKLRQMGEDKVSQIEDKYEAKREKESQKEKKSKKAEAEEELRKAKEEKDKEIEQAE